MKLTAPQIAGMMDLSSVYGQCDESEIRQLAAAAVEHHVAAAVVLPCFVPMIVGLVAGQVPVASVVGFPGGGVLTETKASEARRLVELGCSELDMVLNVGMLRSGRGDFVRADIAAVVAAASGKPVKVILEVHHLTDEHIRLACGLCLEAGAAWVKTATGWLPTGATLETIALMKSCVGDRAGVKASGGVRGLDTLAEMYRRGARRFGVGLAGGVKLLQQCAALPGGVFRVEEHE
ncbi:MAG: deoxyribose-phosphate aldolase [Planctomycetota bacterium]|nr:deoxyribose-phosphate aldolase [Planctomycetota bacterium]